MYSSSILYTAEFKLISFGLFVRIDNELEINRIFVIFWDGKLEITFIKTSFTAVLDDVFCLKDIYTIYIYL